MRLQAKIHNTGQIKDILEYHPKTGMIYVQNDNPHLPDDRYFKEDYTLIRPKTLEEWIPKIIRNRYSIKDILCQLEKEDLEGFILDYIKYQKEYEADTSNR